MEDKYVIWLDRDGPTAQQRNPNLAGEDTERESAHGSIPTRCPRFCEATAAPLPAAAARLAGRRRATPDDARFLGGRATRPPIPCAVRPLSCRGRDPAGNR